MPENEKRDSEVARQHAMAGITSASDESSGYKRTTHPEAQWFQNAGLGMFFHWGLASVNGKCDLSWGMIKREDDFTKQQIKNHGIYAAQVLMTPTDYWAQAEHFLCENYDPDKWLKAAAEAGVKYVVLTTKHHDGFCLWPSDFGEMNTKKYLQGRDLVGEFVAAARRNHLRIGFYYSPPDWYFNRNKMSFRYGDALPALDVNHEPCTLMVENDTQRAAKGDADYVRYIRGHVIELMTRYGQIDILWFDGTLPKDCISMEEIRGLQPSILVNPRGHGYGDFDTPECQFPDVRPVNTWWEYCHVFSDGAWGYLDHESYKPLGWFLSELSKARAWGGNFLPNVGPDSHGELPPVFYQRMQHLKEWMTHSADAVVDTHAGAWPEKSPVPLTHKNGVTYAHFDWVQNSCVAEIKGVQRPISVKLLRTGDILDFTYSDETLCVHIPIRLRTNQMDIVEICYGVGLPVGQLQKNQNTYGGEKNENHTT